MLREELKNMTPDERRSTIKAMADRTEERTFPRRFSEDEVEGFKNRFIEVVKKREAIEDELAEVKDDYKLQLQPLKTEQADLLGKLRSGSEEVTQEVYAVPDHEQGMMEFFNRDGELVEARRLYPHERQTSIMRPVKSSNA